MKIVRIALQFFLILFFVSCSAAPGVTQPAPVMPTQTVILPSPTKTILPTLTVTLPPTETAAPALSEMADLRPGPDPVIAHVEYDNGAVIDGSLVVDLSLDPIIKKVTVEETAYAEFLGLTVYNVWVKDHPGVMYEDYMGMVADVQKTGKDPLRIAIPMWANDANDGIPYQNSDGTVNPSAQKKYWVIPWYDRVLPVSPDNSEVQAISTVSIVLVNGKKVKNVTLFLNNAYGQGRGTTLDNDKLLVYIALSEGGNYSTKSNRHKNVASGLAVVYQWLIKNTGQDVSGYYFLTENPEITNFLLSNGLLVSP